jgi:hypothetical protein
MRSGIDSVGIRGGRGAHGASARSPVARAVGRVAAWFATFAGLSCPGRARAEPPPPPASFTQDTTYGRIAGDIGLVGGVGMVVAPRGLLGAVDVRLRYLDTAGVFFTYEDTQVIGSSAVPQRFMTGGIELRPLFVAKWLEGRESGSAWLDLVVDSIGLEMGFVFQQLPGQPFSPYPGVSAGLGLELPFGVRATGVWLGLHAGVRWSSAALGNGVVDTAEDRSGYLAVTLAWHQIVAAHIVDLGDRAPSP